MVWSKYQTGFNQHYPSRLSDSQAVRMSVFQGNLILSNLVTVKYTALKVQNN